MEWEEVYVAEREVYVHKWHLKMVKDEQYKSPGKGDDPYAIYRICHEAGLDVRPEEHVSVFFLSNRLDVIGFSEVAHGGATKSIVSMQNIFKRALLCNASAFILVHNHPSGGEPVPSQDDYDITKAVSDGAKILGIKFVDHIILSPDPGKFYSMASNPSDMHIFRQ